MTVGEKIKAYLVENGIKQTHLASKSGIYDSTLSDILNKGRRIEVTEYWSICKALGVPMTKFLPDYDGSEA